MPRAIVPTWREPVVCAAWHLLFAAAIGAFAEVLMFIAAGATA